MPQLYAACLASYNNGVLHGRWIEASSDIEEMQEEISAMLRESKFPNVTVKCPDTGEMVPSAEEWAMHDSEFLPSFFSEYVGLKAIAAYMEYLEAHDSYDEGDLGAICEYFQSVDEAGEALTERFVTICESFRDYADEFADEIVLAECASETAKAYFDYEAFARDLECDYNVIEVPSGVAIFYY